MKLRLFIIKFMIFSGIVHQGTAADHHCDKNSHYESVKTVPNLTVTASVASQEERFRSLIKQQKNLRNPELILSGLEELGHEGHLPSIRNLTHLYRLSNGYTTGPYPNKAKFDYWCNLGAEQGCPFLQAFWGLTLCKERLVTSCIISENFRLFDADYQGFVLGLIWLQKSQMQGSKDASLWIENVVDFLANNAFRDVKKGYLTDEPLSCFDAYNYFLLAYKYATPKKQEELDRRYRATPIKARFNTQVNRSNKDSDTQSEDIFYNSDSTESYDDDHERMIAFLDGSNGKKSHDSHKEIVEINQSMLITEEELKIPHGTLQFFYGKIMGDNDDRGESKSELAYILFVQGAKGKSYAAFNPAAPDRAQRSAEFLRKLNLPIGESFIFEKLNGKNVKFIETDEIVMFLADKSLSFPACQTCWMTDQGQQMAVFNVCDITDISK